MPMARVGTLERRAVLEIVEFVERKELRADRSFLSAYPITLTPFGSFSASSLGRAEVTAPAAGAG
jgi:hypothetical protein